MLIFQRVQRDETTFCRRRASRGMATWHKWRPSVNSDRPRKRRKKTFSNKYIQKNRAKREFMNFSMQHRRRVPLGPRRGKRREILKFFLSHNLAQAKCVCINSRGSNSILIRVEKQQEREEGTKKKTLNKCRDGESQSIFSSLRFVKFFFCEQTRNASPRTRNFLSRHCEPFCETVKFT